MAFVFNFPAGLIMYWITTNIWTIGQQQFLRRVIGRNAPEPPPLPEGTAAGGGKSHGAGGGGGGGLLARLTGATQASTAGAGNGSSSGNGATGRGAGHEGAATAAEVAQEEAFRTEAIGDGR